MAIVQALIAAVVRSAGRLVNTAVGWATLMIFGRVSEKRQIYVSIMTFGSLVWIAVAIGIAFPSAGTFLLSFVPLPRWVSRGVVRLVMLAAAVLLPAVVGSVSLLLKDPEDRPRGKDAIRMVMRGYLFTVGLAVTVAMMAVLAPVMKIQTLARRWTSQHVPIVVTSDEYEAVLGQVQSALADTGWRTERQPASWMVRLPTRVLTMFAGGALESLVARELTMLRAEALEAVLHPSDLVISGKQADVVHARAVLAEALAFGTAYLTWTKEGQALEDKMRALRRDVEAGRLRPAALTGPLGEVDRSLKQVELTYEEWEVLYRQKLLLQLAVRSAAAPAEAAPVEKPVANGWSRQLVALGMVAVLELLGHQPVRTAVGGLLVRLLRRAVPSGNGTSAPSAIRETTRRDAAVGTRVPGAGGRDALAHRSV